MLPSLLARDIQRGLKDFLVSSYEPSDPFFHGVMARFVEDEAVWMKGPYLQMGLPFRVGREGKAFFEHFTLRFPGYTHQEAAWQRLADDRLAANTLVATGTGSGKTECFLYPVLDHCARAKREGEQGIKALVIYPMNALAADQARRFAEVIARTPAFAGLRVGLFIRSHVGNVGGGMVMTPSSVITDRETLRKHPPDVLLTNYKMLDYLLIRPKDRLLWSRNGPTTLRYVVVDELHTFDGAQGTDLAVLLRRLRSRLKAPSGQFICVGTSATLGESSSVTALCEYARQIFGAPFSPESVITENRLSVGEFLGDTVIEHVLQARSDFAAVLNQEKYPNEKAAIAAWFAVFFSDQIPPEDVSDPAWRSLLGALLKKHLLFANLLKLLKNDVNRLSDLQAQLQGPLPEVARAHIGQVFDALLALVSWARDPQESSLPLVTVRLQLWLRELRRMVATVGTDPSAVELRTSADLKSHPADLYLPLIQCGECHTTAWLSRLPKGSNKLSMQRDEIYKSWFAHSSEVVRLYPGFPRDAQSQVAGIWQRVCMLCGNVQSSENACQACSQDRLVPIFRTSDTVTRERRGTKYTYHNSACPACGNSDRMILLGARTATLGAQVVERSWASPFNDDKKLIAFSDSVQDAAHRAGFFSARTYADTVRTSIAKAIDVLAKPSVPWTEFLGQFGDLRHAAGSPLAMDEERFVSEFIGPNMTWRRDWTEDLVRNGALPHGSRLPGLVQKRLLWEAFAEFTYRSDRWSSLERLGSAVLVPDRAAVERTAGAIVPILHEQFGLRGFDVELVFQWLWGFLDRLRRRGSVLHPEMREYACDGNVWHFREAQGRKAWLPAFNTFPVLLSLGSHGEFDHLEEAPRRSWFTLWLDATLGRSNPFAIGRGEAVYRQAITLLEYEGLLVRTASVQGDTIALAPDRLSLHTDLCFLVENIGKRRLAIPVDLVEQLRGMPCIDRSTTVYDSVRSPDISHVERSARSDLRRVIAAEHTGLLDRSERESLEVRFKSSDPKPWYENLLSATPTLEMGVDIGDLASVLLCSVPPSQANFLQRIGRAGRRDGNAMATTLADGASPHDLYFFEEIKEMLSGNVAPPGVFLDAAEVLRRQLCAFCLDDWVASGIPDEALPDKTSVALDAIEKNDDRRFPYTFLTHVLTNEPRLLTEFLALLGKDVSKSVVERLTEFYQGVGESDGLRGGLLKMLEELRKERGVHKKRAEQIRSQMKTLKSKPKDEATQDEIDELDRERQNALELVKEINGRELLNTLTDAGLIPNYAFPEAGVELKSILWRKRAEGEAGEKRYISLPTIKYERPAASALSEFAPENRFYANQRRVEVDQITMGLSKPEFWRLCPSCNHMRNLELHADVDASCPRCGDVKWADLAQRRQLLRFKQAIANSDDSKVRIDDSAEEREPKYYVRQLLADCNPDDIREAWRVKSADVPFGFEFIARATFRDVNFGESGHTGDSFKVADDEKVRPGFKLCKYCGKVQTPPRRRLDGKEEPSQKHAFDCEKRGSDDVANIIECLYLYREFFSEALRILVPYTKYGFEEDVVPSFIGALQLGLKKKFGGKVDHLRIAMQNEPGRDGGPQRQYVLLYDSVPGGTGYLHQLLAQDANTLIDVLRMSHDALKSCTCNDDPERDGCYRCLYQYRLAHMMELVSRDCAVRVLAELLGAIDHMEKVPTISDIFINPNFDSALEARFIESLRRLGSKEGRPSIKLVQEIVNGKSGYLLEIGTQRYWVEPQVDIGQDEGVVECSRPDFLIRPVRQKSARRAIAVFCDGWRYHRESIRTDARKRNALVNSGHYWVWSVTYEDVKDALDGKSSTDLESPLTTMSRHPGDVAPASLPRAEKKAFEQNAVAQLCTWLAIEESEDADPVVDQLVRNAGWVTFLMVVSPQDVQFATLEAELERLWATLPLWMQEKPIKVAPALSKPETQPAVSFWWPSSLASGKLKETLTPGLLLIEDKANVEDQIQHERWRQWLRLFNTLQVLPGFILATRQGLEAGDYERLGSASNAGASGKFPVLVQDGAWMSAIEQAMEAVKPGLEALSNAGMPSPDEIGYERVDGRGVVDAEAELAWLAQKLVVLLDSQAEYQVSWEAVGWRVVIAVDGWEQIVMSLLMQQEGGTR